VAWDEPHVSVGGLLGQEFLGPVLGIVYMCKRRKGSWCIFGINVHKGRKTVVSR
jgi:hypothetical protein